MNRTNKMLKFLLMLGVLRFRLSLFMSCSELKYRLWGQTTNATITNSHVETDPHGQTHQVVEYTFMDGPIPRRDYANIDPNQPINLNASIQVQFIPGQDQSRPLGTTNMLWVTLFALSTAFLIAVTVSVCREGYQTLGATKKY